MTQFQLGKAYPSLNLHSQRTDPQGLIHMRAHTHTHTHTHTSTGPSLPGFTPGLPYRTLTAYLYSDLALCYVLWVLWETCPTLGSPNFQGPFLPPSFLSSFLPLFFSSFFPFFFLSLCLCLSVSLPVPSPLFCVFRLLCMCLCEILSAFLRCCPPCFWRQGLSLTWSSLHRLSWLTSEPQGPTCLLLCRTRIAHMTHPI